MSEETTWEEWPQAGCPKCGKHWHIQGMYREEPLLGEEQECPFCRAVVKCTETDTVINCEWTLV